MMKIRYFTFDDLLKLVKLLNETYREAYEFIPYTEENLGTTEQDVASVTLLTKLGFRVRHHWKFLRKNISKGKNCFF